MATFKDFATWAGGQAKAGRLIGVNKLRAHRLYHGARITPEEATRIEHVSGGAFRREQLVFGRASGNSGNTMG